MYPNKTIFFRKHQMKKLRKIYRRSMPDYTKLIKIKLNSIYGRMAYNVNSLYPYVDTDSLYRGRGVFPCPTKSKEK